MWFPCPCAQSRVFLVEDGILLPPIPGTLVDFVTLADAVQNLEVSYVKIGCLFCHACFAMLFLHTHAHMARPTGCMLYEGSSMFTSRALVCFGLCAA